MDTGRRWLAVGHSAASDPRQAGREATRGALEGTDPALLVIFSSGPDPEGLLAGIEDVCPGVPLIGCASQALIGSPGPPGPVGRDALPDAGVGAMVPADGPFGIAMRHGGRKVGEPMIVTHSIRGDLYTLDDKPALTAYLDRLNAPPEAYADPAVFDQFNRSRPIGIRRRGGEEVRHVNSISRLKETWLRSSGEVPEGGLIWVMQGDRDSTLEAANEACRAAIDALDGVPPLGLLAFDCISRSRVLGE